MTIADELNVKEFHVQIPSCDEEAINFATQRKDEAESFKLKLVIKFFTKFFSFNNFLLF